jgi:glutaredoxin
VIEVSIYSRANCHLCEQALEVLEQIVVEIPFAITKILIDGDKELEEKYGEQVPVILINGEPHDFFRVDPKRFKAALAEL